MPKREPVNADADTLFAYIFLYTLDVEPKSYVLVASGIIEELKSALKITLSFVVSPIVIVPPNTTFPDTYILDAVISPDAEIPPFKYNEPVLSSSNFAKVISFPSPTAYCNEFGPLFIYNSPSTKDTEPESLLN